MLFLKNTPINQILSLHEMIETIEDTLKELAAGRGFDLPRRRIHHPNQMIFGLLPGSVPGELRVLTFRLIWIGRFITRP